MTTFESPIRSRVNARRTARTGWLFFTPFAIAFLVAIIAPLAYAVYLSAFKEQIIGGTTFAWLDNYVRAVTDPNFLSGLGTVAGFMAIQIPVILLVALLSALALDSKRVRGMPFFRLVIFIPYAVPGVVAALMWGYIYGPKFGLVTQFANALHGHAPDLLSSQLILVALANISVWQFTGYNMLIFYSAMQGISEEVYEAAKLDGAGEFRKALSIKLPAIRPAVGLALFFSVIGGIQLFTEPSVLQSLAPTVITSGYTPNLYMFNLAIHGGEYNYSAAIAITLGIGTIVLIAIVQVVSRLIARRNA